MIRFAESDSDSEICNFGFVLLTQPLARKGLAVFNRSAHSAGPGKGPMARARAKQKGKGHV